jgi:hypothetical protein
MPRNLSEAELEGIEKRAELCFLYHDRAALRAEDVADLIMEVRELHALRDHLIALNRQHLGVLDRMHDLEGDPP